MSDLDAQSTWYTDMGAELQHAHKAWLKGGRTGPGRLVIENKNLRGARDVADLNFARFVRCDLSKARPHRRL